MGSWAVNASGLVRHIKRCSVAGFCQINPVTALCLHRFSAVSLLQCAIVAMPM